MNKQLEQKLKTLPEAPGIYQMLDKKGKIIYIGKSKCLKNRVRSYFVPLPAWEKAKEMAPFIEDIKIIVTDTHLEAMILECSRIKEIKPYFNSMMKNDARYSYLTLEDNYRRNPLKITATREKISFGPFRSKNQIQEMTDILRNLYPIVRNGNQFEFEYHIFPCAMEQEVFQANQKVLTQIFSGKTAMICFLRAVKREMKKAAERQNYERASQYRDLYRRLTSVQKYLTRFREWHKKDIIYTVPLRDGYKLFYISDGLIVFREKVLENTEDIRCDFIKRAKSAKKNTADEQSEKELLDYREIVYGELAENDEFISRVDSNKR